MTHSLLDYLRGFPCGKRMVFVEGQPLPVMALN